jgi:S1-C subfamily serine protease
MRKSETMESEDIAVANPGAAAFEHFTGPSRVKTTWLTDSAVDILLTPDRYIRVTSTRSGEPVEDLVARLHRSGETYEIEAPENKSVWVNGDRVTTRRLKNRDIIEFGETGPLSRFCLYSDGKRVRKAVGDILSDSLSYLRVSRQPVAKRTVRAVCELIRCLTRETTILFRTAIVIAILVLATLTYQQSRLNALLQQQIERSSARLDSFAAAIARAGEQALRPSDLEALRQELGRRLTTEAERLSALERRTGASARVIAESMPAVIFLQGAYGFREKSSRRMLRHVVDEDGHPLISPLGQPLLTLEGDGPVAERQFTGTGFAAEDGRTLITNRHVVLPWESDASTEALTGQDLEPVMIKFIAYRPGKAAAIPVRLLKASDDADLAILRSTDESVTFPGLRLSERVPAAGDQIIVMGYPTGLRSMLAQSGEAFIEQLQKTKDIEFWSVAARLSEEGHIAPLASGGIVGRSTAATIVYDAETTHGGSGGPVLDTSGAVVAVNTAILPEYGGSNLGVPAAKVRALLGQTGPPIGN